MMNIRWAPGARGHDAVIAPMVHDELGQRERLERDLDRLRRSYDWLERLVTADAETIRQLRRALQQYEPDHPLLTEDAP